MKQIEELKSAEIIDTPEGVARFLAELRGAVGESGDTSVMQTSDGVLFVTKQNVVAGAIDTTEPPSRERVQQMVEDRGMPWDEKYADRVIPWWASDERVDRQGDIVLQNWRFEDYQNNPLMLYAHKWDDPPIGTVLNWEVVPRTSRVYKGPSLRLMPLFATKEQYEWADTIFRLAKARFLRTGSVGFHSDSIIQVRDPNERLRMGLGNTGVIYDKNNLIEWTVAPVPANQGALQSLSMVAKKGLLDGGDLPVVRDIFRSSVRRGEGDADKIRDIENAVCKYWNKLFPSIKTLSTVDTTKQLPQSYRNAEGSQKCENCVSYDPSSDDSGVGLCKRYLATCRAGGVCESWAAKMPVEVTKDSEAPSPEGDGKDVGPFIPPQQPIGDGGDGGGGDGGSIGYPPKPTTTPSKPTRQRLLEEAREFIATRYEDHVAAVGGDSRKATSQDVLEQVFERGLEAYAGASDAERGKASEEEWAYARLESFLSALSSLRFADQAPHDLDLLPPEHPLSEREKTTKSIVKHINREANRFMRGDFVTWLTKGGSNRGQIDRITAEGLAVTDDEEMEAVPEDPVATINPIDEQDKEKMGCGKPRLMPFSRIRLSANQMSDSMGRRCTDTQRQNIAGVVESHNKAVGDDLSRQASIDRAVHIYERGMGSYLQDRGHLSGVCTADQYSQARVASYLGALRGGGYGGDSHDEDLLPQGFSQSRRAQAIKAMVSRASSYEGIDFVPPKDAREEARRGLDWRREYGRGGTSIGVARARDISNGKKLSAETVRRMSSYFARHEVDKKGGGFDPKEGGYPSAGRIAWALWGGDAGKTWVAKVIRQIEARQTKMFEPVGVVGGLRGRMNEASDRYQEIYRWVKTADSRAVKKAVDGVGVRTEVDYSMLWQDEPKARFISSVLLAAEIGGDPRDRNETLKFVRGCVAKAIRYRAAQQIEQAQAQQSFDLESLALALKEFDESKVDRDENGRFASGGGGGSGANSSGTPTPTKEERERKEEARERYRKREQAYTSFPEGRSDDERIATDLDDFDLAEDGEIELVDKNGGLHQFMYLDDSEFQSEQLRDVLQSVVNFNNAGRVDNIMVGNTKYEGSALAELLEWSDGDKTGDSDLLLAFFDRDRRPKGERGIVVNLKPKKKQLNQFAANLREFDESKISRDENGRFSSGGGGGSAASSPPMTREEIEIDEGIDSEADRTSSHIEPGNSLTSMTSNARDAFERAQREGKEVEYETKTAMTQARGGIRGVISVIDEERDALDARLDDYGGDDREGLENELAGERESIEDQMIYADSAATDIERIAFRMGDYRAETDRVIGMALNTVRTAQYAKTPDEFRERVSGAASKMLRELDEMERNQGGEMNRAVSRSEQNFKRLGSRGERIPAERRAEVDGSRKSAEGAARLARIRAELLRGYALQGLRSPAFDSERHGRAIRAWERERDRRETREGE